MPERSNPAPVVAAVVGGVLFAAMLILFGSVLWAIVAGIGGFVAGLLILTPQKKERTFELHGITREELEASLAEGRAKIAEIGRSAADVRNAAVKRKVEGLIDVANRIIEDIREDPKDLRRARQFFSYYLDATINIVRRYASLSQRGVTSSDLASALARTEGTLDTLRKAFEKQLALLLEDDVMDLDTELQLLERTIKMEGLADDET